MDEIARYFEVTRERIRQIEAKALRKLRHPSISHRLRGYLPEEHEYTAGGILEGIVELNPHLSWHNASRYFVSGARCVVNDVRLFTVLEKALGSRVSVSGIVHYRNDKPCRILVQSVRALGDATEAK